MSSEKFARVSVVLPVAAEVPARDAVPVQLRDDEGQLRGWLPTNGRYHDVPPEPLLYLATLPDGRLLQASATIPPNGSARITLQGDLRPLVRDSRSAPTLLDQQKTALRFYVQSSIDSYRRTNSPSVSSIAVAAADQLRLTLTSHATGVQFLQLLARGAFPMNVAYTGSSSVKLVRLERRLAADVSVADPRIQLALEYLHHRRVREASLTLELQGPEFDDPARAEASAGPIAALIVLHVLLAAGRPDRVKRQALLLAERYPDISDFLVIAAECTGASGDDHKAASLLARLEEAGLPLLYRSFTMASVRVADYIARGISAESEDALRRVHRRLDELVPHVDPASSALVIRGSAPDAPTAQLPFVRRKLQPFLRRTAPYALDVESPRTERKAGVMNADPDIPPADSGPPVAEVADRSSPSRWALIAALGALAIWFLFAIFLLFQSDTNETEWARIAWVFGSIEAVAFAAAGLLFGSTVNRQRAETAEARAEANERDANAGRALGAVLKAEEPPVVQEGGGGPRSLGGRGAGDNAAAEVAARHARLARELFP